MEEKFREIWVAPHTLNRVVSSELNSATSRQGSEVARCAQLNGRSGSIK
jgi:hypothetical protein